MTLTERIDQALQARGCNYDADAEEFMDGQRVIDVDELCEIFPDLTLDELAAYQDAKWDALGVQLTPEECEDWPND